MHACVNSILGRSKWMIRHVRTFVDPASVALYIIYIVRAVRYVRTCMHYIYTYVQMLPDENERTYTAVVRWSFALVDGALFCNRLI